MGCRNKIVDMLDDVAFDSAEYLVDGSYYDVKINCTNGASVHYVFDENAYLLYFYEKLTNDSRTEIKVTGYNAAQE